MAVFIQLEFKDDMEANDATLDLKNKFFHHCLLSLTYSLANNRIGQTHFTSYFGLVLK
jgi:hypothetical protein